MMRKENIKTAIITASRGKRGRRHVARILENPTPTIQRITEQLDNGTWRPPHHDIISLREGAHKKERMITKPSFEKEQIIHHMLIQQLRPIIQPKMYELSCGSVPGRGTKLVMKTLQRWTKQYKDKPLYVAELDIKKFYQNIDVEILKNQLKTFIKDDKYLEVMFKVIDANAPGLPLGYYTSPWLGNLYLTPLDRLIIHQLHPDHYARYMDNLFILCGDKDKLHDIVRAIMDFTANQLHLQIKDDWQVFRFEYYDDEGNLHGRAINCLGFVIHCDRVSLRKPLLKRIRRKAIRIHSSKRCKLMDAYAMISYSGWLQNSDTYTYYCIYIKPNVSFHYCKHLISKTAKRSDKNDRLAKNIQQCCPAPC